MSSHQSPAVAAGATATQASTRRDTISFQALLDSALEVFQPDCPTGLRLVTDIARIQWTSTQLRCLETAYWNGQIDKVTGFVNIGDDDELGVSELRTVANRLVQSGAAGGVPPILMLAEYMVSLSRQFTSKLNAYLRLEAQNDKRRRPRPRKNSK